MNDRVLSNKEFIIEQFLKVKNLGYVKSRRANNTGIGKTFEDYVGVVENNESAPDLAGYEIKCHRDDSNSLVTLFTKSPSFPKKGANAYLRDKFGQQDEDDLHLIKLHTSMFANRLNSYAGKYSFKLLNNIEEEKLYIGVFSLSTGILLDKSCGYTYSDLQSTITKKLKNLFYVEADSKTDIDGTELFHFNYAEIYSNPSFDLFLKLIDSGLIQYDIRLGSFKSGIKYGQFHDHGDGFRISDSNLLKLYAEREVVG